MFSRRLQIGTFNLEPMRGVRTARRQINAEAKLHTVARSASYVFSLGQLLHSLASYFTASPTTPQGRNHISHFCEPAFEIIPPMQSTRFTKISSDQSALRFEKTSSLPNCTRFESWKTNRLAFDHDGPECGKGLECEAG